MVSSETENRFGPYLAAIECIFLLVVRLDRALVPLARDGGQVRYLNGAVESLFHPRICTS